ncbi:hypothetical protein [Solibacillus sp. CAU 1738]|uniref:hypothetical protein n=1 Tax=Solibacillus sp. CAU 1738 TaxID=3140363 RepID=UPI0032612219
MDNNGKVWIVIGGVIAVIGLVFTIAIGILNDKQIKNLVTSCENDGGEAVVKESGFIFTTSYEFKCNR